MGNLRKRIVDGMDDNEDQTGAQVSWTMIVAFAGSM
jgi:hypothetical protein